MDERGRRGDLLTVIANNGNWIRQDSRLDISEPAKLVLRRSNFELRGNSSQEVTINEKYAPDVLIKIPCGELPRCTISREDGGKMKYLELLDSRTRDTAVLAFRAFHKAAMDEKKKMVQMA